MKKLLCVSALIASSVITSTAQANPKVGVALDMGLSVVGQIDRYNVVLGDDGFAVDYLIKKGVLDNSAPLTWYVSGGGWAGWNHGFGIRVPVGISWSFEKNWDLYGQVQPVADFDNEFDLSVDGAIGVRYAF